MLIKVMLVFLNDLFYEVENADVCNFPNTIPHCCSNYINEALINIEHDCTLLVEWFRDNFMTLNASKCHLLIAGYRDEFMFASVEDTLL